MAFGYKTRITIDHTQVPSDLSDFRLPFHSTLPYLKHVLYGGRVRSLVGLDIGFTSDEAGASLLDWDIDEYDPTTGELVAWIRIPTLSSSVDTTIYLQYSDVGIVADQSNAIGVWTSDPITASGYRIVLHLPSGANKLKDSTRWGNNATPTAAPATIAAQLGHGVSLNGTTQYLEASGTVLSVTGRVLVEMWFYPTNLSIAGTLLQRVSNFLNYKLGLDSSGHLVGGANTRDFGQAVSSVPLTLNAWNKLEAGFDGVPFMTNGVNFVVLNGVRTDGPDLYDSGGYTNLGTLYVGASATPTPTIPGRMDEVRIHNFVWTQDRSSVQYAAELDPESFYELEPVRSTFTLGEALIGREGPIYWSRLAHRDAAGAPKAFPWSPISIADPASYMDGYKDGILLSIGDIACPLSDRDGRIQIPTCDVTYWDAPGPDGLMQLRGMMGRSTQKAIRGAEFTIYSINDRDRRLLLDPIIVFRGYVDRCEMPPGYQFTIHARGWIAKRLESKLWTTKVGDICPLAPPETFRRIVPVAFGILSDEGSDAGPIVFVDDEAGRGGHGGAPNPISSYGDIATPPVGLSAVEAAGLGNINLGDNPGDAYYVMYTRVVAGVESDPDPFLPESITPVVISGDGAAIDATGVNDGADSYRFYIGRIFTGNISFSHYLETADAAAGVRFTDFPTLASQQATPITPGGIFAVNPFAYVSVLAVMTDGSRTALFPSPTFPDLGVVGSAGYNRPVRFAITPLAGADFYEFYFKRHPTNPFQFRFIVPSTQVNGNGDVYWTYDWGPSGYEIVDGAPAPEGVIPPIHCGKFTDLFGGNDWDGWMISARQCVEYIAGYLDGVRIEAAEYGISIFAPGMTGYDAVFGPPPFSSNGFNPFMVFMRNHLRDRALGLNGFDQELFKVNVKGHIDAALNDVETSIYEQFRMIAKNNLVSDAPTLIGAWDQEPTFSDGTPRVDDASIDKAAEDALAVIPGGPTAARWLSGDMTVAQFLLDICPSGKMKHGIKPNGQLVLAVHNPDAEPDFAMDEATEIIDGSFAMEATDQGFANAAPYQYAKDYDENGSIVFVEATPEEDLVSQGASQFNAREAEAEPWSLNWRRSAGLSRQIARAFLRESAYLPQPAQATSVLHWVHRRPGEVGSLTHRQGATESGYTRRKHAVLGMRIALGELTTSLMLLDLRTDADTLSFYQYEEFMAGRYIGGSRADTCLTEGGVVVPFNWFEFLINWDEIPGTHGQRARILTATNAGNIKPSIFLAGEDPAGDTAVVEGVNNASSTFDEQVLEIPRDVGEIRYWMLPKLSGGATDADAKMYGFLEGYRL